MPERSEPERKRFEFRFAPAYRRAARIFGVTPETAWVELRKERLEARFGPWHLESALGNIAMPGSSPRKPRRLTSRAFANG